MLEGLAWVCEPWRLGYIVLVSVVILVMRDLFRDVRLP